MGPLEEKILIHNTYYIMSHNHNNTYKSSTLQGGGEERSTCMSDMLLRGYMRTCPYSELCTNRSRGQSQRKVISISKKLYRYVHMSFLNL